MSAIFADAAIIYEFRCIGFSPPQPIRLSLRFQLMPRGHFHCDAATAISHYALAAAAADASAALSPAASRRQPTAFQLSLSRTSCRQICR
jgi:hypothetical protein